ncbi:NifB/NifX family molybdenum-iron cluster-binding protein [Clostridium sp. Mt-5]|uniref:NifB/NifX family molybdenum-iron cluster-binding protein n=1 Tax=Clostridium moutaii TaxID=3240932 RepID=A0ABV4BKJ0_9CLOT
MIISVPYENGQVFQHFGHTKVLKIYEVTNNEIVDSRTVSTDGRGHGALVTILKSLKVSILICGGIGGGAKNALVENGIQLFGGVAGSADKAVKDYIAGKLNYNPNIECNHHHDNSHDCGEHEHSCSHHK